MVHKCGVDLNGTRLRDLELGGPRVRALGGAEIEAPYSQKLWGLVRRNRLPPLSSLGFRAWVEGFVFFAFQVLLLLLPFLL